jgi:hypothetical protein
LFSGVVSTTIVFLAAVVGGSIAVSSLFQQRCCDFSAVVVHVW